MGSITVLASRSETLIVVMPVYNEEHSYMRDMVLSEGENPSYNIEHSTMELD